nr:junctophilin-1 isoform X1 [Onthophagus taurus]
MQQPGGPENGGVATSPASTGATGTATAKSHVNGGRFDFDDGGTFCGGWEEGKAHGHGVCTGPKGQGAYSGSWHYGFEVSGVYTWPSGSTFEGQWQNGKRHGLGVETRGRWIYRGEWTQGFKGRYGVRQSNTSAAKYEGTWANGLQDGYGSETYADEGTYQGQWLRGMRHGYGVRTSAAFGRASKFRASKAIRASMTSLRSNEGGGGSVDQDKREKRVDDTRGGFVLKMDSSEPSARRRSVGSSNTKKGILGWKLKRQRSTGDIEKRGAGAGSIRSTASTASWTSMGSAQSGATNTSVPSDSNASFVVEDEKMDPSVKETYMGEWKNDKRTGFGVSERSDGLKYEGEWYNNKKYGYGVTTFSNGEKEEGKYKNNVLITNPKKKHLFLMRSAKFRERIDAAVGAAQRASKIALQKADIAISRTATARGKAEQADIAAAHAREDSEVAMGVAKKYAPDFKQPGLDRWRAKAERNKEKYADLPAYQKDFNTIMNQNPSTTIVQNANPNVNPNINPSMNPNMKSNMNHQMNNPNSMQIPTYTHTNPSPMGIQEKNFQAPSIQSTKPTNNPVMGNHISAAPPPTNNPIQNIQNNEPIETNRPRNDSMQLPGVAGRRLSRRVSADRPYLGNTQQQSSIDHFDHYKRPPSRDCSVDRYSRAAERLGGSRQPSIDRTRPPTPLENVQRGTTPVPTSLNPNQTSNPTRNGGPSPPLQNNPSIGVGIGSSIGVGLGGIGGIATRAASPPQMNSPPFEDIILKKRSLGQDIVPSLNQPKRTESLHVPAGYGGSGGGGIGNVAKNLTPTSLSRKKSMPDFQELPRSTEPMAREEVSMLGSARREEVRRQAEERERLRANPLLYLVSPQVKDWFSRQQLVIVVLFVNISLAIIFYKILT